jgi:ketosteroid isomerase-like protein
MNAFWGRFGAATAIAMTAVATSSAPDSVSTDVVKIRALESGFAAALVARDLDAVMRVYIPREDLFIFEAVPPRQVLGATAYRQHVQDFFVNFRAPFTYDVLDVVVTIAGEVAYGHNIQHLLGVDKSGNRIDMTFRVTDVYRKVKGDWFIVQEHASFPVDPQTGKADFSSAP